MRTWPTLALALAGCGSSNTVIESGLCVDPASLSPVTATEIVALDGYVDGLDALAETGVATTQAEYDALQEAVGVLASVDFDTHRVMWASAYVSSSCAVRLDGYSVGSDGASAPPHLHVDITDTTGSCGGVCDALGGALVVVAVETTQTPTVCRELVNACE